MAGSGSEHLKRGRFWSPAAVEGCFWHGILLDDSAQDRLWSFGWAEFCGWPVMASRMK